MNNQNPTSRKQEPNLHLVPKSQVSMWQENEAKRDGERHDKGTRRVKESDLINLEKVSMDLVRRAESLRAERKELETELNALDERRKTAELYLAAYNAEHNGNNSVWLGTPSKVQAMKQRLEAACRNEKVLLEIVEEVRTVRKHLTDRALGQFDHSKKRG